MKYSIITINFNNEEGLKKTIESVINQTFRDFEYIVIDGGSTDGSKEILKKYDAQITYWVSEKDKGIYNAMNKGISHAVGDYLNFMNSGDSYHTQTVLEDIAEMNYEDDIIIGGFCERLKRIHHIIPQQEITLLSLMKYTPNHQATFYKRKLFCKRLYDESYKLLADRKFNYLSIIYDNCSVKIIDNIVADYDTNGVSSIYNNLKKEHDRLLEELFPNRIMKDYERMYTQGEVPLVTLLPELKESPQIQRLVYRFAKFLIKIKHCKK